MESGNGVAILKITLFVLNLLFLVFGIELVWIGSSIHLNLYPLSLLASKSISEVPAVLIIVGVLIFFMAVFGIAAVWKENVTVMKVFLILMTLVFLVEVTVEVSTYISRSQMYSNITDGFEKSMHGYDEKSKLGAIVDRLQIKFHCCGSNNYTDWFKTTFGQATLSVPSSCCINITESCGRGVSYQTTNIHIVGCTGMTAAWIEEHFSIIRGTGVGFAFAQVIGIFISCFYIKKLQDNYIPGY